MTALKKPPPDQSVRRNRIKEWRIARGLSLQRLADKVGTTKGQIDKLEKGSRRLTQEWMERIAAQLGLEPGDLLRTSRRPAVGAPSDRDRPTPIQKISGRVGRKMEILPLTLGERDLPILGVAQGGTEGILVIPVDQAPVDFTYRPPQLKGVEGAFAVLVYDGSMAPKYEHGQTVLVHPAMAVRPGDGVLIIKSNDNALVKVLVRRTDKEVILRQYDPPEEFTILRRDVRAIYRIFGAHDPTR